MVPRQDPFPRNTTQKKEGLPVPWRSKPYKIRCGSARRHNFVVILHVSAPDGHEVLRNASSNRSWARLVRTYTDACAHIRTDTDAYARIRTRAHRHKYTHIHTYTHRCTHPCINIHIRRPLVGTTAVRSIAVLQSCSLAVPVTDSCPAVLLYLSLIAILLSYSHCPMSH